MREALGVSRKTVERMVKPEGFERGPSGTPATVSKRSLVAMLEQRRRDVSHLTRATELEHRQPGSASFKARWPEDARALGLALILAVWRLMRRRGGDRAAPSLNPSRVLEIFSSSVRSWVSPISASDAIAAFRLGMELEAQGDLTGAQLAYRRADERGHGAAASSLGVLLEEQGALTDAEAAYRRADQRGDATGAFNLGVLLHEQGAMAEAEAAYRRADQRGDGAAASNLGVVLEERGALAEAEAAYRRADQRRDATGAFNLGVLLENRGALADAEAAYRRAEQRDTGKVANRARAAVLELGSALQETSARHA